MKSIIIFLSLICVTVSNAQDREDADTLSKVNYKQIIIPATLITYGVIGLNSPWIIKQNHNISNFITPKSGAKTSIDNYAQYAPALSVYALNVFGVKGKNNFKDRTFMLAGSYAVMALIVNGLKMTANIERPDGSANNSFPSGHTATAFCGAEFLWQEYKDQSVWYGIAGYGVASAVGVLRMYNNRHWFTDVVAGAGIGMFSTKFTYWIYPKITRNCGKDKKTHTSTLTTPYYNGKQGGLAFIAQF